MSVHLTQNDITADTVSGDLSNSSVTFCEASTLTDLTSGENLSGIFGKLKLAVKNLKTIITLLGSTDISAIGGGTVTGAINSINSNLSVKADRNGTKLIAVTTEVVGDRNAFASANFVAAKPVGSKNLAGYGFHNPQINGKFLYLGDDSNFRWISNTGDTGFLSTATLNNNPNYQLIHYLWPGTTIAGQTVDFGPFDQYIPAGRSLVCILLTPRANTHVSLSYINNHIYGYSSTYSGPISYDCLMFVV